MLDLPDRKSNAGVEPASCWPNAPGPAAVSYKIELKDSRSAAYAAFVGKAVEIAKSTNDDDPSPGKLVAWRTATSGSPGKGFLLYKTVFGNDFYYQ